MKYAILSIAVLLCGCVSSGVKIEDDKLSTFAKKGVQLIPKWWRR